MSRTAVVIIHGIGEQRPMATLRGFVSDVITPNYQSKPDRLSELYEVRRLNCGTIDEQELDCYELYWAHHMRDSRPWHLFSWLIRLLRTPSDELTEMSGHIGKSAYTRMKFFGWLFIFFILIISVAVVLLVNIWGWLAAGTGAFVVTLLVLVGKGILPAIQTWLVKIAGDAARYFDSLPDNVGQRQAIRSQCISFLRSLDKSLDPSYDRIVIIGHSLGSVIAYDALKFWWATLPEHAELPISFSRGKGKTDEKSILQVLYQSQPPEELDPQDNLFTELARMPAQWKVSDLITVGSPLTHAPILLAGSMKILIT